MSMGGFIVHIKGYQVTIFKLRCILIPEENSILANSVVPDEMPHKNEDCMENKGSNEL